MSTATRPKKKPRRLTRLLFNRVTATIALGLVFLIGFGLIRPRTKSGLPEQLSELEKLEWHHRADVVIAGDSRSAAGLSPQAMKETLGTDQRIFNFAFSDNGWTGPYLEHVPRVLDPSSKTKIIIAGISPLAMSPRLQKGGYIVAGRTFWFRFRWKHFGELLSFFEPMDKWQLVNFLRGKSGRGFFRHFHEDGWLESNLIPPKPEDTFEKAQREFVRVELDPKVIDAVLESVRAWTGAGITVYGFRTPTEDRFYELETELAKFDTAAFARRWEEAGGIWLTIPTSGWTTYDGSHLIPDEARRLSRLIATKVRTSTRS